MRSIYPRDQAILQRAKIKGISLLADMRSRAYLLDSLTVSGRNTMRIITGIALLIGYLLPCFAIDDLRVQGLFKDTAIVTIDGKRRVLKVGKVSPEGALLIQADSNTALIEIDGHRAPYRLSQGVASHYKKAKPQSAITVASDHNGLYFINGSINGFQVKFLIDTGATSIALSEDHAKRLGLNYKLEGRKGRSQTASGETTSWMIRLDKVKIASLVLRDLEAHVIQGSHPKTVLLGNSFLNQVKLVRDGRKMKLYRR